LDLSSNKIPNIDHLKTTQLRELYLAYNDLVDLPKSYHFESLTILDLSKNSIEYFPQKLISDTPTLQELNLYDNNIQCIIDNFQGGTASLERLDLSHNKLLTIPNSVNEKHYTSLASLNIAHNSITTLPEKFSGMIPNLTVIEYEQNLLYCDHLSKAFREYHPCKNQRKQTDFNVAVAFGFLSVAALVGVIPFYILVMRAKKRIAEEAQSRLYNMSEREVDDGTLGISVSPSKITFGSESMQLPVYRECKDVLFLKGIKSRTNFRLVLPVVPSYKCVIDAAMTQGEVVRNEEFGIELSITMMCTTSLQIPLLVVTEHGYATVYIEVESQLSTRLDADEIEMGAVLGVGGYGTVYRGSWRGVDVAVKVYNQTILADFATRGDFEREVEMCFKLRMPYIVTFYGKTVSPDRTYIVMEYVPYGSLAKLMEKRRFTVRYKARMALDIARGMNYLHKNRIIHRDLKPDNVLVASIDPDSCVCGKLSDFNTSRFVGDDASMDKTRGVGTPIYMAPEIFDGKHYNGAADVYSYALTIWSIWAQKEPYSDLDSSLQIYQLIINGERLTVPSEIPEPLAQLTRECWAQKPEARPEFSTIVQRLEKIFSELPMDEDNNSVIEPTPATEKQPAVSTNADSPSPNQTTTTTTTSTSSE